MKKFIKTNQPDNQPEKLYTLGKLDTESERLSTISGQPFVISFQRKLEKGYRLDDLQNKNLKAFQKFLDIASELTVGQMDKLYQRPPDKKDIISGRQVQHYKVSQAFRIHGIFVEKRFEIIRIDPNHKVHK